MEQAKKAVRMSEAGSPCEYRIWKQADLNEQYSKYKQDDGKPGNKYSGDTRNQQIGKLYEDAAISWLREDGWEVKRWDMDTDGVLELSSESCIVRGVPDCFISKGEKQHVLADIKTMSEGDFEWWKKRRTATHKPQWKTQLCLYALAALERGIQVDWIAIIGVNRNDPDYYVETMKFDRMDAQLTLGKLESIMQTGEKVPCCPDAWSGKICESCWIKIKETCPAWQARLKAETEAEEMLQVKADPDKSIIESEDPELDAAIKQLKDARLNIARWKAIEDEAKDKIDELVLTRGIRTVYSGNLILQLTEVVSPRFNLNDFKKAHPELLSDFMKSQSFFTYKIKETGRDGE